MDFKKANFEGIYNERTPESYLRTLASFSYRCPDFVDAPLKAMAGDIVKRKGVCTVLDVAASYGFNGAILKFGLPFGESIEPLKARQSSSEFRVIGLDVSAHAISYARNAGFVDAGIIQNLEQETLTAENQALLREVDMIVASGAFSYVSNATFDQLLDAIPHKPAFLGWPTFACNATEICASFAKKGIALRIDPVAQPMRNFISEEEKASYFSTIQSNWPQLKGHSPDKLSVYTIMSCQKEAA